MLFHILPLSQFFGYQTLDIITYLITFSEQLFYSFGKKSFSLFGFNPGDKPFQLYPAYVIQDDIVERTSNGKHFEPLSSFLDHTVSDICDRDAFRVDIYARMRRYSGEVLIIHGTDDQTVPIAYSCEAVETFPHARMEIIEGGGHGFIGKDNDKAMKLSLDFIKNLS